MGELRTNSIRPRLFAHGLEHVAVEVTIGAFGFAKGPMDVETEGVKRGHTIHISPFPFSRHPGNLASPKLCLGLRSYLSGTHVEA